jgi:hypothetical protein
VETRPHCLTRRRFFRWLAGLENVAEAKADITEDEGRCQLTQCGNGSNIIFLFLPRANRQSGRYTVDPPSKSDAQNIFPPSRRGQEEGTGVSTVPGLERTLLGNNGPKTFTHCVYRNEHMVEAMAAFKNIVADTCFM